jgi:uncharacterized membrane protein
MVALDRRTAEIGDRLRSAAGGAHWFPVVWRRAAPNRTEDAASVVVEAVERAAMDPAFGHLDALPRQASCVGVARADARSGHSP